MAPDLCDPDRYSRQIRFRPMGAEGQARLARAAVLVVGCGALGSSILETLARAGVGRLRFVDRDTVELSNLPRQALYTEVDVVQCRPKAVAARDALRAINSAVVSEAVVADFNATTAPALAAGMDLILDGTDNFETRFLMNELAVRLDTPYIYGAALSGVGTIMPVVPGRTPCLRCIMPEPPEPGTVPTCDQVGVIAPVVRMVAAQEAALAMRVIVAGREELPARLIQLDAWTPEFTVIDVSAGRRPDCPVCGCRRFALLDGVGAEDAALDGKAIVQLQPPPGPPPDLERLAARLAGIGAVTHNPHLLRLTVPPHELVLFHDGRCVVRGTTDPAEARRLRDRYLGASV
ncbi:MAG: thiazole biosynthesis adenylyltransferase ThiF [Acidobacteria bacterium]|nr:thiazole biosynthesis adenylyltransferase ThiF [Acidobacteriota bacterium]